MASSCWAARSPMSSGSPMRSRPSPRTRSARRSRATLGARRTSRSTRSIAGRSGSLVRHSLALPELRDPEHRLLGAAQAVHCGAQSREAIHGGAQPSDPEPPAGAKAAAHGADRGRVYARRGAGLGGVRATDRIGVSMRRILLALAVALPVSAAAALPARALTVAPLTTVSTASPFPPGCGRATEGSFPGSNYNYANAEVEPWLAVNPAAAGDVAGFWQQDRWSDGGAHGLVAAVSHDGGATWAYSWPHFSNCAGGDATNGGNFGRSSD